MHTNRDSTVIFLFFQYLGDWYQVAGTPSFYQPVGSSCVKATYGEKGNNSSVHINKSRVRVLFDRELPSDRGLKNWFIVDYVVDIVGGIAVDVDFCRCC